MNKAVEAAYKRVRQAERERDDIIRKTYAVGDIVAYEHGRNYVKVEVVSHSYDRLKVRGLTSGREYWISAYRVIQ